MDAGSTSNEGSWRWQAGQGPAAETVVEWAYLAFHGELERRLAALVRDQDAAADIAQETFLRLHVEVEAGRGPDDVRAWLHRVAGNLAASRGRRVQVALRHAPRLVATDLGSSTEEVAIRHDGEERIARALGGLRPLEREVLLLAAAGVSGPEIAVRIGRSDVATRTLLCRARGHLRLRVERLERSA